MGWDGMQEIKAQRQETGNFHFTYMEDQEDACCNHMIPMKWNQSCFVLFPCKL